MYRGRGKNRIDVPDCGRRRLLFRVMWWEKKERRVLLSAAHSHYIGTTCCVILFLFHCIEIPQQQQQQQQQVALSFQLYFFPLAYQFFFGESNTKKIEPDPFIFFPPSLCRRRRLFVSTSDIFSSIPHTHTETLFYFCISFFVVFLTNLEKDFHF
jgi:hypothetical protein